MYGNQQGPFGPPPPMGWAKPPGQGMATASLVMGILSLVFWCLCIGYAIFAPLGIIFCIVAKNQGSTSGMATAGLVTSIISIVTGIIYWIVFVLLIGTGGWLPFMFW